MPRHRWQWSREKAGRIYGSRSEIWTTDLQVVRTTSRVVFLTGPPDFQYQNEKQVAANRDYFFKKFSM